MSVVRIDLQGDWLLGLALTMVEHLWCIRVYKSRVHFSRILVPAQFIP